MTFCEDSSLKPVYKYFYLYFCFLACYSENTEALRGIPLSYHQQSHQPSPYLFPAILLYTLGKRLRWHQKLAMLCALDPILTHSPSRRLCPAILRNYPISPLSSTFLPSPSLLELSP